MATWLLRGLGLTARGRECVCGGGGDDYYGLYVAR